MVWPAWLWIGTPLKFSIWLVNRIATWTGLYYFWSRLRASRVFWLWLVLINVLSWGALALLFFGLQHHFRR